VERTTIMLVITILALLASVYILFGGIKLFFVKYRKLSKDKKWSLSVGSTMFIFYPYFKADPRVNVWYVQYVMLIYEGLMATLWIGPLVALFLEKENDGDTQKNSTKEDEDDELEIIDIIRYKNEFEIMIRDGTVIDEKAADKITEKTNDRTTKQELALEHALDIRKFEIDLYWRRAAYFWTFIGVTFVGFMTIQHKELKTPDKEYLSIIVGSLGFAFSFAWYLVNRGSKYWQENWENHVDLLEDEVTGPLYKVVISRPQGSSKWWSFLTGPAPYSVSKINQITSLIVCALWLLIIVYVVSPVCSLNYKYIQYLMPVVIVVVCVVLMGIAGKTDMKNHNRLLARLRKSRINKDSQDHK
jgi:hypothetical protein